MDLFICDSNNKKEVVLSGPIIQEKAKTLFATMGEAGEGFKASSGWFGKWKSR